MTYPTTPLLSEVLLNPGSSRWLRVVLQEVIASDRDPFDAAADARLLASLLEERARCARSASTATYAERGGQMIDLLLPLTDPESARPQASYGVR